jgi:hypothetical protein
MEMKEEQAKNKKGNHWPSQLKVARNYMPHHLSQSSGFVDSKVEQAKEN